MDFYAQGRYCSNSKQRQDMDLKDKTKLVKVLGSASAALTKLEESVHAFEAQGKSPPKADVQLLKSIQRALDLLKINSFAGDVVPHNLWPAEFEHLPNLFRFLCPSLGQEIQRRQLVAMKSPWERCNQSL